MSSGTAELTSLKALTGMVELHLQQMIPNPVSPYVRHRKLFDAARYSLLAGGKRIRPLLCLATVELFGGNVVDGLTPACTLELIHTASLIHDDLPCMDDDDFRRGKPTLHKVVTEGMALLAGDYLLAEAFGFLANARGLSAEQKVKLVEALSFGAGGEGMAGGQGLDIDEECKVATIEELNDLHERKTGAMIVASLLFGGIIGNATSEQMEALEIFGREIGLAFQIIDDVLDVTSTVEELGKPIGSDVRQEKVTYVNFLGVEGAKEAAERSLGRSLAALELLPERGGRLREIAELVISRRS